ncbi:MAG: SAM-dependent methyltransferase [Ignavibacteria bacterium]
MKKQFWNSIIIFQRPIEVQEVMAAQGNKKSKSKIFNKTFKEIQLFNIDKLLNSDINNKSSDSVKGRLILVTTPIGDFHDITYRALYSIKDSEYLLCEDTKESSKLLRAFGIKKDLNLLNEHNESVVVPEILKLLLSGVNVTLISDCGTPAFADPGLKLVNECIQNDIKIDFVHGANSVISAITISGFDISRFYFYGFLSPKNEIRIKELKNISSLPHPVILMDTPYRMSNLINDLLAIFPDRNIFLALNLSTKEEKHLRGKPCDIKSQLSAYFGESKPKAEFIVVLDKLPKHIPVKQNPS